MKLRLPTLTILFLLLLILPGRTYLEVRERIQRLGQLRDEVEALRDRRSALEEELAYRQSSLYIETTARAQLNYAAEGEVIIVLPDFEDAEDKEAAGDQGADDGEVAYFRGKEIPSWQKNAKRWRTLFFGE